jgi:cytochrome c peroxidase
MPFPATLTELETRGYKFQDKAECRGCHAVIYWYKTPTGARMPMNPMDHGDSPAVSHFSTCTEVAQFRK